MTTANCSVNAGYTFVFDSEGKVLITLERLNLVSVPVVTVNLAGQVNTADIVASAVTAAKLADAVADAITTAVATVGDDAVCGSAKNGTRRLRPFRQGTQRGRLGADTSVGPGGAWPAYGIQ